VNQVCHFTCGVPGFLAGLTPLSTLKRETHIFTSYVIGCLTNSLSKFGLICNGLFLVKDTTPCQKNKVPQLMESLKYGLAHKSIVDGPC
jgi:hypothetical protein